MTPRSTIAGENVRYRKIDPFVTIGAIYYTKKWSQKTKIGVKRLRFFSLRSEYENREKFSKKKKKAHTNFFAGHEWSDETWNGHTGRIKSARRQNTKQNNNNRKKILYETSLKRKQSWKPIGYNGNVGFNVGKITKFSTSR